MADYITLLGTEDVVSAARTMSAAADTMRQAAWTISEALQRHEVFLLDLHERQQHASADI